VSRAILNNATGQTSLIGSRYVTLWFE